MTSKKVTSYKRKKQPELVQQQILDAAIAIGSEKGLASLTVQAVADRAGVTKGGLLHHFPSKQALVEEVSKHLLSVLDREIEVYMQSEDENAYGRFTRSYIETVFSQKWSKSSNPLAALAISAIADPDARTLWSSWIGKRLARHRKTDSDFDLEIARPAADGVWLKSFEASGRVFNTHQKKLKSKLIALTFQPSVIKI